MSIGLFARSEKTRLNIVEVIDEKENVDNLLKKLLTEAQEDEAGHMILPLFSEAEIENNLRHGHIIGSKGLHRVLALKARITTHVNCEAVKRLTCSPNSYGEIGGSREEEGNKLVIWKENVLKLCEALGVDYKRIEGKQMGFRF